MRTDRAARWRVFPKMPESLPIASQKASYEQVKGTIAANMPGAF